MANTNLNVLVKAQLDSSGVKAELKQIQKIAKKYPVELLINLKSDTLKKDIKRISQDIAELGNALGKLNLPYHSQIAAINEEIRAETKLLQVREQLNKSILRSATFKMPAASSGNSDSSQTSSTEVPIEKYTGWIDTESSLNSVWNLFLLMKDAVCEVDTAMSALHDVTDETSGTYQQFLENANVSAQKLGKSVSGLVEQTANWAGMGFDLDDAGKLAETSTIYSNISGVDAAAAISNLVAIMETFQIKASDSLKIVDSLYKLGKEFSTDSASLGDGLKNSASVLRDSGNDINQTLAMLTGGTELTQDASQMSDALSVISLRIGGMKSSLKELGAETDDVMSVFKIQDKILSTTNGNVNILDSAGNLKSTYKILEEISKVWDKISNTDQTALLETLGGKQHSNQTEALIQAFQSGQVQKAMNTSMNSSGSALEGQAQWMDGLSAKTQQFEAAFQSLSHTIVNSNFLKGLVDTGTGFLNILETITDKLGLMPTLMAALGAGLSTKNLGRYNSVSQIHCFCF